MFQFELTSLNKRCNMMLSYSVPHVFKKAVLAAFFKKTNKLYEMRDKSV